MSVIARRFVALVAHVLSKAIEEFRKLSGRTQALVVFGFVLFALMGFSSSKPLSSTSSSSKLKASESNVLKLLTWNIAAINNNPFEYWLTLKDEPMYDEMMNGVEKFVLEPIPRKDQLVSDVITQEMFDKLAEKMTSIGFQNVDTVREMYTNDWSKRRAITQFLRDPVIGKKRLVSMPDRVTNTITTTKGTFYRPTPINCYDGKRFTTLSSWYEIWLDFMFSTVVNDKGQVPAQLLEKIPRAKYPALTEEEEDVSIPLQTLVIAIFDAIQVRMLNQVATADVWQSLRDRICLNLNRQKTSKTLGILTKSYADATIMFLQEVAASFIQSAKDHLGKNYHVVAPAKLGSNDQNSLILLNKAYFDGSTIKEHTDEVLSILKQAKSPVAAGDLLVIEVRDKKDQKYFLASFHGDTNGLATIPVVKAVRQLYSNQREDNERFIFGMDANTYERVKDKKEYQDVMDFVDYFTNEEHLTSCWVPQVNPKRHTTRNARTYMQPQLSKAASKAEVEEKGDANPKDFILFEPDMYSVDLVARDNTGTGGFLEGMVFPTLDFPSDHAIVRTVIREVANSAENV